MCFCCKGEELSVEFVAMANPLSSISKGRSYVRGSTCKFLAWTLSNTTKCNLDRAVACLAELGVG